VLPPSLPCLGYNIGPLITDKVLHQGLLVALMRPNLSTWSCLEWPNGEVGPSSLIPQEQSILLSQHKYYLSFLFVEFVSTWKTLHWDQQVSKCALELWPFVACKEKLQYKSLNLNLIKIWEKSINAWDKEIDYKVFVAREFVWLSTLIVDWSLDDISVLNCTNHLL